MTSESTVNCSEYEFLFLSVDEKKDKIKEIILRDGCSKVSFDKNKSIFVWAARMTWNTVSHNNLGIGGKIDANLQDFLSQDVLDEEYFVYYLKKNVEMIRRPEDLNIMSSKYTLKAAEIPDGIYKINIFNSEKYHDRTNTLTESEIKLWNDWLSGQPADEGIIYHPIFNQEMNELLGIKIFFQGHRGRCHIRTISIDETKTYIESGKQISIVDYINIQ